jgi:hypothetical protein
MVRDKVKYEFENDFRKYLKRVERMERLGVFSSPTFTGVNKIVLRREFIKLLVEDIRSDKVNLENIHRMVYAHRGRGISVRQSVEDTINHMQPNVLDVYNTMYYA